MVQRIAVRRDLELAVETFEGGERPLVLIMGLGAQMLMWPDEWCEQLADAGFRVIRFDNRDIGLSTRMRHLPVPRIGDLLRWWRSSPPPYTLDDLADDTVGLLDALDIERAHVVGASMGGMVAQILAFRHPDRVSSLTSIMSTPSLLASGLPRMPAIRALLRRPRPGDVADAVAQFVNAYLAIGSPVLPAEPGWLERLARRCIERGTAEDAVARQSAAILAGPDRRPGLATVTCPACVIHGALDPLLRARGGLATARALGDAEWLLFGEMGHDLPRALWPRFTRALVRTAARAA